jgi:hypothetical protein
MISYDELDAIEASVKSPQSKAILRVLIDSYRYWLDESKKQNGYPYDEHVENKLWEAEIAIHAFKNNTDPR